MSPLVVLLNLAVAVSPAGIADYNIPLLIERLSVYARIEPVPV